MEGISDKVLHSPTFRYLVIYLAVMTTITFFLVGFNQSSVCSTQRENAERTIKVYGTIEDTINGQIGLYRGIQASKYPTPELNFKLETTIKLLQKELKEIKEQKPEKVSCLIF